MEFNFVDKGTEEEFERIIKKVKLLKNGVVADALVDSGLKYDKIWGVAIPHLRSVAKGVTAKHALALMLWNKKWRETMILASMLEETSSVEDKQVLEWLSEVNNIELSEQLAFNLISNLSREVIIWVDWIKRSEPFGQTTILKGLYRLTLKKELTKEQLLALIDELEFLMQTKAPDLYLVNALGRFLACAGRSYPELIESISAFIAKFVANALVWKPMADIAETEFEWLNDV